MGSSLSMLWGTNDNVIDPATNLSGKQKKLVLSTWNILKKDPTSTGVAIMTAYFKKYPEYQKFFVSFKDIPLEELPGNHKFQAHCLNVITALGIAIDAINNPPLLEASLTNLGERHRKRGQTREHFDHLKVVVLEVLSASLGSKYTLEVRDAWSRTLDTTFECICKELS
ncbi:extracellular globin-E1 [Belonocnema kinseyi]|uniref:extracellular globin-E1 n=1 Tax=Belonocnema kinseyi TaxID=2817044 RepID=UPI00143D9F21|nr:extracellular globin-E1 [Belonocnema kinseyi]XP_033215619.1 extracellular globin-E1 [Belonocnema kinseyi]